VDGVHGDAVGVRGLGDVLDQARAVVAHRLEHRRAGGLPALGAGRLFDLVEGLAAGLHREPLAGEDEDLLPLDAGQRGHESVDGADAGAEVVLDRGGVLAGDADRLLVALGVLDPVLGRLPLAAAGDAEARLRLQALQDPLDLGHVARERHAHLHAPVVGGDHGLVAGAHGRGHELLHLVEDPVAVEGGEGEVVDVDDDPPLHVLFDAGRHGLRGRSGSGAGLDRIRDDVLGLVALDLIEVRDRFRDAVLEDLEVLFLEAGDGVAAAVGDDHVDVDDPDVDGLDELRGLRFSLLFLGKEGSGDGERQGEGESAFHAEVLRCLSTDHARPRFRSASGARRARIRGSG